jgi:hypothetical protein
MTVLCFAAAAAAAVVQMQYTRSIFSVQFFCCFSMIVSSEACFPIEVQQALEVLALVLEQQRSGIGANVTFQKSPLASLVAAEGEGATDLSSISARAHEIISTS